MNMVVSFPLWVTENDSNANGLTDTSGVTFQNDGREALNAMKLFIGGGLVPVDEFYGFPMPRGTPFMKATGDNEIEVITARTGV
jgi:hypothetical protein